MSAGLTTLLILAALTYGLKAAGPVLLGGDRTLPSWVERLALLLPAPLLAALVATSAFVSDSALVLDAKVVGLFAAGIALWFRLPFVLVVVVAAAATALTRAIL